MTIFNNKTYSDVVVPSGEEDVLEGSDLRTAESLSTVPMMSSEPTGERLEKQTARKQPTLEEEPRQDQSLHQEQKPASIMKKGPGI